jgi:uncharacterized protein (DUF488 family)
MGTVMETAPTVWTVGHSNHELERLVRLLHAARIEFVIDVRSYPYSRYAPQFNREALEASIPRHGMRYVFLGEQLGGRPTLEEHYDVDGHALYGPMSEEQAFTDAVQRVIHRAREHRLALLCSEAHPRHCHRRLLVGKVLTESGVRLEHILPEGDVHSEETVVLPGENAQCSLLGEEEPWRSTQSVSRRARLSTSSAA